MFGLSNLCQKVVRAMFGKQSNKLQTIRGWVDDFLSGCFDKAEESAEEDVHLPPPRIRSIIQDIFVKEMKKIIER